MKPWRRNTWAIFLLCLLIPPAGAVVLWLHPEMRIFRKVYLSVGLLILTVIHLFAFYGLRVELAGSGEEPIFYFQDLDDHYGDIESIRAGGTEIALASSLEGSAYWTDYRGPNRDGLYDQQPIRTHWEDGRLPELWRRKIGGGYASMVVAKGRIYTIEQRREREVVACYDLASGTEIWSQGWEALFQEGLGGNGPRATPTWREGRIYALGATGELHVFDAHNGKPVWNVNILEDNDALNLTWAMSASPLIVDEKVITLPGGPGGQSVVAYHKDTGEPVWRSLDDGQAYTAPMAATLAGRKQLLIVSGKRLMGLTIEDGSLLWEYPWRTSFDANCSQPAVVDENHVFISAGYGHGSALVKVTSEGGGFAVEEIWSNKRMKSKFNPPVLYKGHVYGLDEGILQAIDVRTGAQKWKGGRYGYGQVLLADGHLIVLSEKGEVALVKATPEGHRELAKFPAIQGKTWNHPAISDGKLLVRNQTEMACYDLSAAP